MEKRTSFIISLFAVFMLITSPGKSSIKFQDILDVPRTNNPVLNSPEKSLIDSYKRLRAKLTLNTFEQRAQEFNTFIFDPIDSTNIVNQNNYIDEIIYFKRKLSTVHPLFQPYFKNHVDRLDHRLDLERIDKQIFTTDGIKGSFSHLNIPLNMRPLLSALTGKIFLITQNVRFTNTYSLTETKPQYWESEDIAIGNIALKLNQNLRNYQNNIVTNFDTITDNQALIFNNGEQYFAIGYPVCNQYDPLPFNLHPQLPLIEDMGLSPLFVTSSTAHDIGGLNQRPVFNNGVIKHGAPTSKGMSGGLLIRVVNGQIEVFGCIGGKSDTDEYEGCY